MKVVIVEDERAAARNLVSLLAEVAPQVHIETVIDSVAESIEWFNGHAEPDAVFMDIHLADGSAFDIFDRIKLSCPIIFTTAYDEYALRAFKVNGIDYLLKPISPEELAVAVEKLSRFKSGGELDGLLRLMSNNKTTVTHLLVPSGASKLIPLDVNSIEYFFIENSVVRAVTVDGTHYVIQNTLDELGEMVDGARFFRLNRQYLITRESIDSIELWFGSRLSVNLKLAPSDKVVVSKPRVAEFKAWFTGCLNTI